jgi:hypothetical protein
MRITRKRSTSNETDRTLRVQRWRAGVTLVEMVVATAVFMLLVLTFFKSVIMVRDGNNMMDRHNRVNTRCQRILNQLGAQVASSVRLYEDDAEGRALLGILGGLSAEMLGDSKLPVLSPTGIMEKDDPGTRFTGNCLLFLKAEAPFGYKGVGGTQDLRRIDVFRVVAFYLKRKEGVTQPLADRPDGLDLVAYRSVPLIDRGEIDAIVDDVEREQVLALARQERRVRFLFDTRRPVMQALGAFADNGVIDPNPPDPYLIPPDPVRGQDGLFAQIAISVATNGAPNHYGIGRFSEVDTGGEGFPHGFETRVIGGASARQILLHLTLVLPATPKRDYAYADLSTMAVAKDF